MKSLEIVLNLVRDGAVSVDDAKTIIEDLLLKENIQRIPQLLPTTPTTDHPYDFEKFRIWCNTNSYQTDKTLDAH